MPDNLGAKVTSFFSFKGGVGRTSLLARMAIEIQKISQRRVCAIDLDLEAPGFHAFFDNIIDTSIHYILQAEPYDDVKKELIENIAAISISYENLNINMVNEVEAFFKGTEGATQIKRKLEDLIMQAIVPAKYSHVLIDNRTGLLERVQSVFKISDNIVFVFRPDHQNLKILQSKLQKFIDQILDGVKVAVIISMTPDLPDESMRDISSKFQKDSGLDLLIHHKNFQIFTLPLIQEAILDERNVLDFNSCEFEKIAAFLLRG